MQMSPVASSLIESVGHNGLHLHVRLHNGAIYQFQLPVSQYEALKKAKSVGKYFNEHIRHHPNICVKPAA